MSTASTTVPKRDNLFGVCAALGEDFGFDPFCLRVALAVGVIASPIAVLIGYASAGVLVLLSRVLVRGRRAPVRTADVHAIAPQAIAPADREPLRQAA